MIRSLRAALAAASLLALACGQAAAEGFTDAQKKEIGEVVRAYLLEHPELLLEVSKELEARQEAEASKGREKALTEHAKQIFRSPADLVGGNPDGDVTVVEFFDYNCGWCKKGLPEILSLIEKDKKLRLVMKEFPIFGGDSDYAAMAALASRNQGKYWQFHVALLAHEGKVTKAAVDQIAGEQGLDVDKLKADMKSPEIARTLAENQELAGKLNISGTPAFVVDSTLVPGYVPADGLMAAINDVRASGGCKLC
jgi:protein-disulfide isomerase